MALAALIVKIGGDLTGLNRALSQADKDVVKVGKKLTSLGKDLTAGLTVPIVGAGIALAAAAVNVGNFADVLLDLVDQTGLSSDTLQEFRHVATIAGVETDTLANAAIKLTTKLSSGGEQTKELTGALAKLGLKATDASGRLVSMDKLLPAIIGKLQGMDDVTLRNAIAADVFGKSWAELAPILGLGAGAMAKAQQEARDLGLVLSKESIEAADAFRKKLGTLKNTVAVTALEIGGSMLPAMTKLVDFMQKDVVPAVRSVVKWFDDLSPTTVTVIGVVAGLAAAFGPLLVAVGTVMKFWPLLNVAFAATAGPVGAIVLAVGLLAAAAIVMVKNWDATKLQFTLAWTAMKEAAFFAIDKILGAVAGMAMAFKMTGLAADILKLGAELKILADEKLAVAGSAISALETKMNKVAAATVTAAGAVTKLVAALDKLPDPSASVDYGWGNGPIMGDPSSAKKSRFGKSFGAGDSMGTKVGQVLQAGGGAGQIGQMVQAFAAFGPLAALLPVINGALEKLEPVIVALIEPLVEIGRVIGDSLAPIIRMLVPVMQLLAQIITSQLAPVLKGITIAFSFVMEALGWLVLGVGKLIDSLPFVSAKGVINAGQAMIDNARAARRNAAATEGATDAVNSFASALSNIPRVLNINALRHMVTGGPGGPIDGGGGGGGRPRRGRDEDRTTVIWNGDVVVPGAGDPERVANAVAAVVERSSSRGGRARLSFAVAT